MFAHTENTHEANAWVRRQHLYFHKGLAGCSRPSWFSLCRSSSLRIPALSQGKFWSLRSVLYSLWGLKCSAACRVFPVVFSPMRSSNRRLEALGQCLFVFYMFAISFLLLRKQDLPCQISVSILQAEAKTFVPLYAYLILNFDTVYIYSLITEYFRICCSLIQNFV